MQQKLLIVESPSKIKTIQKFVSTGYIITASMGHVRQLASTSTAIQYDHGFKFQWVTQITKIKEILKLVNQCSEVIFATDPDREGEAIAYHIMTIIKEKIPNMNFKRVKFNEITKPAITHALQNPEQINMDLVNAYFARIALDHKTGYTLSPILWNTFASMGRKQSAGRVQSPALRLVVERELERQKFSSHKYYSVHGTFNNNGIELETKLHAVNWKLGNLQHLSADDAQKIDTLLSNNTKEYRVASETVDVKNITPSAPYTTFTLQQDISTQLNIMVGDAMGMLQKLYEAGYITYHRSDSTYMSETAINSIRTYIQSNYADCLPDIPNTYDKKAKNSQEAHECIRPSDITVTTLKTLESDRLQQIYTLIRTRALASQMLPAKQQNIAYILTNNICEFAYRESHIIFASFLALTPNTDKHTRNILKVNSVAILQSHTVLEHTTQPARRYTEASLIKELENRGIGRPSTIATIFKNLELREYIEYSGRSIAATFKAAITIALLKVCFSKYVDYEFTNKMEKQLDQIANGANYEIFLKQFFDDINTNAEQIKAVLTNAVGRTAQVISDNTMTTAESRAQIMRLIGDVILINTCAKCSGKLYLVDGYQLHSECEQCHERTNLQVQSTAINETLSIINTGKYKYVQLEQNRVYVPDFIKEVNEQSVYALASLPASITYQGRNFAVNKTFKNFYIRNDQNKYFNFFDVNMLQQLLAGHYTDAVLAFFNLPASTETTKLSASTKRFVRKSTAIANDADSLSSTKPAKHTNGKNRTTTKNTTATETASTNRARSLKQNVDNNTTKTVKRKTTTSSNKRTKKEEENSIQTND
jgi:DNA topoisomerase I